MLGTNTLQALKITQEGDKLAIKELRQKDVDLLICGQTYRIKPYAVSPTPFRLEPCKFGDRCRAKTSCRFWHSEKERHVAIVISTSKDFVEHLQTLMPGLSFKFNGTTYSANAFAPATATLRRIISEYQDHLKAVLTSNKAWKTTACGKNFEHDTQKCMYLHEGETPPVYEATSSDEEDEEDGDIDSAEAAAD
jgi:hypothetical protein